MAVICYAHCLKVAYYSNFFPINGTYQNFNPVRRFLSGQVPYVDFCDYLGLGHLYSGTFFTVLFGGNYNSSLKAFNFLAILSISLIFLTAGFLIFKKKWVAPFFADVLLLFILFKKNLCFDKDITDALNSSLSTGNSARFLRGIILPLSVIVLIFLIFLFEKINKREAETYIYSILFGIVSGLSFLWSNDYGLSCFVCYFVFNIIFVFSRDRNILKTVKAAGIQLIVAFAMILILSTVLTGFHPLEYLKSFTSTGGYQGFYYNSSKKYYLYEIDFDIRVLIQFIIFMVYFLLLFKNRGDKNSLIRFGLPGFLNMACYCAINEYRMLSGDHLYEVAFSVLYVTVLAEIVNIAVVLLEKKYKKTVKYLLYVFSFVTVTAAAFFVIPSFKENAKVSKSEKKGVYFEKLGGNVTTYGEDLLGAHEFLKGEKVFSTYASALEVVEGTFQPSGIDYIIHVLGDKTREEYIESFETEDFKYAAVIKEYGFDDWEIWLRRANWFFYRKLYKDYHPVYSNSYETFFEKNSSENIISVNGNITTDKISDSEIVLKVNLDEKINGIGEILIDYSVEKSGSFKSKLIYNKLLKVKNTGHVYSEGSEKNYLRSKSCEYIPVTIEDGYGEITLSSCPEEDTYLDLKSADISNVYPVVYEYLECSEVKKDSVKTVIITPKGSKAVNKLSTDQVLVTKSGKFNIEEIREDEEVYSVTVTGNMDVNKGDMVAVQSLTSN